MTEKKLTAKEKSFVKEYLVDLNASAAAIRAGYSEKTAGQIGYELLSKPHITVKIQEAMDQRAERTKINADFVLNGIQDVIKDARAMKEHGSALKGFELLGKHLKLFTDVQEHKHEFTSMGRVMIGDPAAKDGTLRALVFNVGQEADKPKGGKTNEISTEIQDGG